LLDWSSNPIVALFFALDKNDDKDGAIYVAGKKFTDNYELFDYKTADIISTEKGNPILRDSVVSQNQGNNVVFVRPKYTDQRYLNQKSIFSCHANPFENLDSPSITKIIIRKEWKCDIRTKLDLYGITHSFIYPGLEGITKELKVRHYNPIKNGKTKYTTD